MHQREGSRAAIGSSLLRSKLRRPVVPEYFVHRPRLERRLDGVTTRPVTAVIAPAGSGKTQLLSNWAAQTSSPVSWLSLEEMDDDPVAFWTGIIVALWPLAPGAGATAGGLLAGRAPLDDVVVALLDDIDAARTDDAVLVLDDIHHVRDATTAASLALFVLHLPSWLHIVLVGRTDPMLPLDRMRVRDQLVEVRFDDLRLSTAEAREMLSRLTPDLGADEVDAAVAAAEGWAAGLQLTALAARLGSGEDDAPPWRPNSQRLTADYVWHEILAAGDADMVDLLMRVAVVDRVSSPLAVAIGARSDAHRLLLAGEAQGLFVHRLGEDDWFRIHPLVREALLGELRRRGEHAVHHERAARWLEDAGETVIALEQWLLAGRHRDALRLLSARSTELYDQGREALMARTLEAIPRELVTTDVAALIDLAVCNILFAPVGSFVDIVRETVWHAERSGEHPPGLDALRSIAATMCGDFAAGAAAAQCSLAGLGGSWWSDPAGRFAWNTLARCLALSEQWDDDAVPIREATIATSRDPRRGIALEGIRAVGHAFAGRPVDALRTAAGVGAAASTMSLLRVELALAEAVARLELGDRVRAIAELTELAARPDESRVVCPLAAMLHLADDAVDVGDTARATGELVRATALVAAVPSGPDLHDWVRRAAVVVSIGTGDIDGAARAAGAMLDPFWAPVSRARLDLALGDATGAARHLADAVPRCPRHHVVRDLLLARAAPDEALARVAQAVELAATHGMLRTVVVDGRELTRRHRAGGVAGARRMAAAAALGDGADRAGAAGADPGPARDAHRSRARRAAPAPQPADAERDRRRAVRLGEHGEVPPARRLPQARRQQPRGGGGHRPVDVQVDTHRGPLTSARGALAVPPAFGWWPPTPDRCTLTGGAAAPTIVQSTKRDTVVDLRESDSTADTMPVDTMPTDTMPTDDSSSDDGGPGDVTAPAAPRAERVAPTLTTEQLRALLVLIDGADSVELKTSVPDVDRHSVVASFGLDPLDAEIRQVAFYDTPDLRLNAHGVVVRVRRIQAKPADSVIKLRPVTPADLPGSLRRLPGFGVEVDAMPGGFVCSASLKAKIDPVVAAKAFAARRIDRKLFTKEQRTFFASRAPDGLTLDDLVMLGPINIFKLKFAPVALRRKMVAELWLIPDGTRVFELSTKCPPSQAFEVAAQTTAVFDGHLVDLSATQGTTTRTALEYFAANLSS